MTELQQGGLALSLRRSFWLYPVINSAHVLGIVLLLGPILTHHLVTFGALGAGDHAPIKRLLTRVAEVGFCIAISAGVLLWLARPLDYSVHAVFQLKIALIALALINVAWLRVVSRTGSEGAQSRERIAACVSCLVWLGVLFLGRLVGYR